MRQMLTSETALRVQYLANKPTRTPIDRGERLARVFLEVDTAVRVKESAPFGGSKERHRMLLRRVVVLVFIALLFSSQLALAQFTQQGPKLVGNDAAGGAEQGNSVALSADGNTAIVGGGMDNSGIGAAWIYTRNGGVWSQQGSKLVGNDFVGVTIYQGASVALSADGNTAIVGGPEDDRIGAAWVYIRSGATWTQQGPKLVGAGGAGFGRSVALSADGNTALIGGPGDNNGIGAAWVFIRNNGVWTQQGNKLTANDAAGQSYIYEGTSVALSADGNTAIVGGYNDNSGAGAAWVFIRSNGGWTQQGPKLVGAGAIGTQVYQGTSVALSADGNTAIVGGYGDNYQAGASWVFARSSGVWTQQGNKLVGSGAVGTQVYQGTSVALSGDGNTAIVGGPGDNKAAANTGAAWVFIRSGAVWSQQGSQVVGTGALGYASQGESIALSADGKTAIVGGPGDGGNSPPMGAAWVFTTIPSLQVTPPTNMFVAGNPGGPFAPSSIQYQLSATVGSISYTISGYPNWLTPCSTSGAAFTGTTVTFTVNANANSLAVGTYGPATITFANSPGGQGTQTRTAMLTVNPPALQVASSTGITVSGTHGGPFAPTSFQYALSSTYGSVKYSITNVPSWLTVSPSSGTVTAATTNVTFRLNSSAADKLTPNTYVGGINFNNTSGGQGNATRVATIIVNPKPYKLTLDPSPPADGTASGGGEVAEGSSTTVVAAPKAGHTFVNWTETAKVVSASASYTFTMPSASVTLIAHFK
jgi:hypothetical protein